MYFNIFTFYYILHALKLKFIVKLHEGWSELTLILKKSVATTLRTVTLMIYTYINVSFGINAKSLQLCNWSSFTLYILQNHLTSFHAILFLFLKIKLKLIGRIFYDIQPSNIIENGISKLQFVIYIYFLFFKAALCSLI